MAIIAIVGQNIGAHSKKSTVLNANLVAIRKSNMAPHNYFVRDQRIKTIMTLASIHINQP